MNVDIRKADLSTDKERIISCLRMYLNPESDHKRFEWLYLSCPDGKAMVWLATERESDKTIGAAAAFPRRIYIGENETTGWVLGDFCIAPEYRSLGPALKLQRSLIDGLREEQAALYYDFPSSAMMMVYRRLGVPESGRWTRFVRFLRTEPLVKRIVPFPVLCVPASGFLDLILRPASRKHSKGFLPELQVMDQSFTDEFSELDRKKKRDGHAGILKTKEYLNWKFRTHRQPHYSVITGRMHGVLVGFIVFTVHKGIATIVDINTIDEDSIAALLDASAVYLYKSTSAGIMQFPLLSHSKLADISLKAGFKARESAPFVLSTTRRDSVRPQYLDPANWILTSGDRDS
jgi:hypothetical protein